MKMKKKVVKAAIAHGANRDNLLKEAITARDLLGDRVKTLAEEIGQRDTLIESQKGTIEAMKVSDEALRGQAAALDKLNAALSARVAALETVLAHYE